jgi:hypothetical protein
VATLALTANSEVILRFLHEVQGAVAPQRGTVTVTLDNAPSTGTFSVTYNDGAYGSKTKVI